MKFVSNLSFPIFSSSTDTDSLIKDCRDLFYFCLLFPFVALLFNLSNDLCHILCESDKTKHNCSCFILPALSNTSLDIFFKKLLVIFDFLT